jgi:LysM repeat protein
MATEPTSGDITVPRTVVAQPGDTIWGIARNLMPNGDITELVDVLVRLNGDQISAGQIIRIP